MRLLRILLVAFATTQLACASFHGLGEFKTAADSTQAAQAEDGTRETASTKDDFSPLQFDWPVDQARLTQRFLPHKHRRPHWGIDLASERGTRIISSHYGTVVYTGSNFKGYGKLVIVEAGPNWATVYSHLDTIKVKEGQMVHPGQLLGQMGRTGRATGVHLHFEVRNNRMPVNPLNFLPGGQNI